MTPGPFFLHPAALEKALLVAIRLLKTSEITLSVLPRLKPNCAIISRRVGSGPVLMVTTVIMLTESTSSSIATLHSSSWNDRGKSSTPSVIWLSHARLGCLLALVLLVVGADQSTIRSSQGHWSTQVGCQPLLGIQMPISSLTDSLPTERVPCIKRIVSFHRAVGRSATPMKRPNLSGSIHTILCATWGLTPSLAGMPRMFILRRSPISKSCA